MDVLESMRRACELVGGTASLARALGVTKGAVHQWRRGERPVPIVRCVQIESLTAGRVVRSELRPSDWTAIWPELAKTPTRRS